MRIYDLKDGIKFEENGDEIICFAELDCLLHVGENIKLNNKLYHVHHVERTRNYAGVHELELNTTPNRSVEGDELRCPYCNHNPWQNEMDYDTVEDHECDHCGGIYNWDAIIIRKYTTETVKSPVIRPKESLCDNDDHKIEQLSNEERQKRYDDLDKEIESWPRWKKDAYNDLNERSNHSKKY